MEYAYNYIGGVNRATLKKEITIEGIGLHSGCKVTLKLIPAPAGNGLVFRGRGSRTQGDIPVTPYHVIDTQQAVTLGNGVWTVSTVEHLLAALAVAGVTDLDMEIDAPEMPILDGSAEPFYMAVMEAGIRDLDEPLEPITLNFPVWAVQEDRYIIALPYDGFRVTYGISFDHPLLRGQSLTLDLNSETCVTDILPARTFGFFKDLKHMQSKGLALGASLDNAIVLTDDGVMNEALRFENECIRHKTLDLLGDLFLIGRPLKAHIIASKAGHMLDVALGQNILDITSGDELEMRREIREGRLPSEDFRSMV